MTWMQMESAFSRGVVLFVDGLQELTDSITARTINRTGMVNKYLLFVFTLCLQLHMHSFKNEPL
jgi:NAD/NADP transhydrogenase beta subunit